MTVPDNESHLSKNNQDTFSMYRKYFSIAKSYLQTCDLRNDIIGMRLVPTKRKHKLKIVEGTPKTPENVGTATASQIFSNMCDRERSGVENVVRTAISESGTGAALDLAANVAEATGDAYRHDTKRGIELAENAVNEGKMTDEQAQDYIFDRAVHKMPNE